MVGKILIPEIKSFIDARDFAALRDLFREWPPADVAEVILDMDEDDQVIVFRVLPSALAADVFEYLDTDAQQKLLHAMAHEQCVGILNEMSPDDRTALLEEMPSAAARQLIKLLTPEERRVATALLGYPEGSVGRLMTPDFIAINEDWSVQDVLTFVRENGHDSETINVIYVVDERGKLIDDLRIREFLLRPLDARVSDFRDHAFTALKVNDSEQDALNVFRKYDRTALPVVDSNGVLVGIVTVDDMLDVAEQEATEDIQKLGGMEALDEPYGHSAAAHGKEASDLADHSLPRRNADCHCDARLQRRDREGRNSGDVFAVDHFQRRQFRIASNDARYSRHGPRRIALARLVARGAEGTSFGTFTRPDSWNYRLFPNLALAISAHLRLRTVSLARCHDGRYCTYRGRFVGHDQWSNASILATPFWAGSSDLIGAVCRYACRCNGINYLLQRGAVHLSWHAAVTHRAML
jgi:CBS domain-containing protein